MLVGLTGGIGSGKTAAADYFAKLGIDVVDADLASRAVVEPGQPALDNIAGHFGPDILLSDGSLDRAKLRAIVFAESDKRKWLQNLLHPLISDYLRAQIAASTSPYCLLVNPLLLESGQGHWCDEIVVVDVPETVQVARTMARDDNSRSQVESIMAAQMARSARLQHASKIITNDKDLTHLHDQINTLHKDLLQP